MKFYLFFRTLLCYTLMGTVFLVFVPPLFLLAFLPDRYRYDNRLIFFLLDCVYRFACRATLCPIKIIGEENLPTEPSIFAPNHQSALDIALVGSLCRGTPHVWLVLEYYSLTPVLGFFIRRMFVSVDRSSLEKAARSLVKLYRFVQGKNRHLIIFPEGGRFTSGRVSEFFEGFAFIARKTARPVVPIFMPNNRKIYPPGSFYIYPYPLIAIVGEPLIIGSDETDKELDRRGPCLVYRTGGQVSIRLLSRVPQERLLEFTLKAAFMLQG